jgi:oxygen-independent coproporphyrinogen-3 oxidase
MKNKDSQNIVTLPNRNSKFTIDSTDFKSIFYNGSMKNNNLYVHIPYCTGICTYCSYVRKSAPQHSHNLFDSYLNILEKEAMIQNQIFGIKPKVDSIYIGGGTPTILSSKQLERLCHIISKYYVWDDNIEYTLEGCPETTTPEKLEIVKDYGINRVSLGVESFDDEILQIVNRRHRKKDTIKLLDQIKKIIPNIDIDILSNLPGSSYESTFQDAVISLEMDMPSVHLYHMTKKPKSIANKQDYEPMIIEQVIKWGIFDYVMTQSGNYTHDNYERFSKKNSKPWEHIIQRWKNQYNNLTLGIGCYGFFNDTQFFITQEFKKYFEMIDSGLIPMVKKAPMDAIKLKLRSFIFGLKIPTSRYDINNLENVDFVKKITQNLENKKLVELVDGKYVQITKYGKYFVEFIQNTYYNELWVEKK